MGAKANGFVKRMRPYFVSKRILSFFSSICKFVPVHKAYG
jgi:hypothetical protein